MSVVLVEPLLSAKLLKIAKVKEVNSFLAL